MIVTVILLVWIPLMALVFFCLLCRIHRTDIEDLGPDFSLDRAPDYVGHDFLCDDCGHYAGLDRPSCPGVSLRGRCPCGTVYELIP